MNEYRVLGWSAYGPCRLWVPTPSLPWPPACVASLPSSCCNHQALVMVVILFCIPALDLLTSVCTSAICERLNYPTSHILWMFETCYLQKRNRKFVFLCSHLVEFLVKLEVFSAAILNKTLKTNGQAGWFFVTVSCIIHGNVYNEVQVPTLERLSCALPKKECPWQEHHSCDLPGNNCRNLSAYLNFRVSHFKFLEHSKARLWYVWIFKRLMCSTHL